MKTLRQASTATNGQVHRQRRSHVLPPKIEEAFHVSRTRRDDNKTSRLDYAAGYEDGYRDALEQIARTAQQLQKDLTKP
jgi:hypothetical protein